MSLLLGARAKRYACQKEQAQSEVSSRLKTNQKRREIAQFWSKSLQKPKCRHGTKIEPRKAPAFACTTSIGSGYSPWLPHPVHSQTGIRAGADTRLLKLSSNGSTRNGCTKALLTTSALLEPSCHNLHKLRGGWSLETSGRLHSWPEWRGHAMFRQLPRNTRWQWLFARGEVTQTSQHA